MAEKKKAMNYQAVAVIGIAAFILSLFWYSPIMFGGIWKQYRHAPNPEIPQWTLAFAPLRELIASYVLAYFIIRLNVQNWREAARIMLLLWLAFHAIGMTGAVLWDNMQWQLGIVHAGDWLMKMLFMGLALAKWLNQTSSNTNAS